MTFSPKELLYFYEITALDYYLTLTEQTGGRLKTFPQKLLLFLIGTLISGKEENLSFSTTVLKCLFYGKEKGAFFIKHIIFIRGGVTFMILRIKYFLFYLMMKKHTILIAYKRTGLSKIFYIYIFTIEYKR